MVSQDASNIITVRAVRTIGREHYKLTLKIQDYLVTSNDNVLTLQQDYFQVNQKFHSLDWILIFRFTKFSRKTLPNRTDSMY